MEFKDPNVEAEIEEEKERLMHVKGMIAKSIEGRQKMKTDFEEFKMECQRKLDAMRNIMETQSERASKMEEESARIKNANEQYEALKEVKETLEEELNQTNLAILASRTNFSAQVEQLRKDVKQVYEDIRAEKENKFLMETALVTVQDKENTAAVVEAMRRLENCTAQERLEAKLEAQEIERQIQLLENELEEKKKELKRLQEKNELLRGKHARLTIGMDTMSP